MKKISKQKKGGITTLKKHGTSHYSKISTEKWKAFRRGKELVKVKCDLCGYEKYEGSKNIKPCKTRKNHLWKVKPKKKK